MKRLTKTNIFFMLLLLLSSAGLKAQSNGRETAFKMAQLFDWIGSYYADSVNMEKMSEDIIRKTLLELDPHSVYISKSEVRAMNEPLEGSFNGIGVAFDILNDTILVISAVQGGPSDKVGVVGGDRIIFVDGENLAGKGVKTSDVFARLRGAKGSEVTIGILRRGYPELLSFRIVRDRIPIYSIDAAYMVTDHVGYIKLSRFSATTKREFDAALQKLKKEGMTDLILDLTGNGGGYMDTAAQLANEFLERGQLMVYTEGKNNPRRDYRANSRGEFTQGKLAVMIDERSASASEILAGAVQDWDRGVIVGRRSFGKGLVQRPMIFSDSSMLRLTVARYHTPSGRAIQKPYNTQNDEYAVGLHNSRRRTGELTGETSAAGADSPAYLTLLKKRTVFGGGGITPDVFVAMDTSYLTSYYRELLGLGIFNRFVRNYIDKNRSHLQQQYPTFQQFDGQFSVSETMLDELQAFAEKEGLSRKPEMFAQSRQYLQVLLKGYIARDLWEMAELYQIVNRANPVFLRAVEEIEKLD
jgi:carboxyl-terminal processing protease